MKKGTVAILLAVLAGTAACSLFRGPERSACIRMAELCGVESGSLKDLDTCTDDLKKLRSLAGDEAMKQGFACVDNAKTCSEGTGCLAGTGWKGVQGAVRDFFKGLGVATK